ncbi:Glutamyl-tRNA(Gln) amidotransferase subunit A [Candidatus Xenohaliotis californiensis]|uniref:Glutamyl-tRNA(Gln) amidotransferase subunit A n=1 Tax=Candidatus Xenohaliotis californiensis TaxID=84677 RepID=A0ABM9N9J7_9RICK|nr:Glutamyl-tRNA(Gln) amidotransferase subunit A [Candidatus Xenohaliotis californiensis]
MKLCHLGVKETILGLKNKDFSATELAENQLAIAQRNEHNAFVYLDIEKTMKQAKNTDERIANGKMLPLDGVLVGVKDLFCTKNIKTTACSKTLEGFIPPYESTTTQRLWNYGAIFAGKMNMDEFAMGSTTEHSIFGRTINPWSKLTGIKIVPGGSSGGSAAAVSNFSVPVALGSDTGGSVRQPSSLCGIVGLKPTYGRCSRWGMIAFGSSLDCPGILSRSVEDVAIVLGAIAGFDHKDSTSFNVKIDDYLCNIDNGVKGLKIGMPKQYFQDMKLNAEIDTAINKAIKILSDNGAIIKEVSIPNITNSLLIYYITSAVEAISNLARYDGIRYGTISDTKNIKSIDELYTHTRTKNFGREVRHRLLLGGMILRSELKTKKYKRAQAVRQILAQDFHNVFKEVDCIISPTAPTPAFGIADQMDELTIYQGDLLTTPANMACLPAISIPVALTKNNRPLGLQIMAKHFNEKIILQVAKNIENFIDFNKISKKSLNP